MKIINKKSISYKIIFLIMTYCAAPQMIDGMDHRGMRQTSLLIPFTIGAACIVGAIGAYNLHKAYKKRSVSSIEKLSYDSTLCLGDKNNGGQERTIKITYSDKGGRNCSHKQVFILSPKIIEAFDELRSADNKIQLRAIGDENDENHILTLALIQTLFKEACTDDSNPILVGKNECCFLINRISVWGASDEVKKKIALKYAVPQIEHLLENPSDRADSIGGTLIPMVKYLPDTYKATLESRLYGLRFKTPAFELLVKRMTKLFQTTGEFLQSYCDTIHNYDDYTCNREYIKKMGDALYDLNRNSVYEILPIFTAHRCVTGWYQSFEYQLYAALLPALKPNMITCFEYTNLKRSYALSWVRSGKDSDQRDVNIFTCEWCKNESQLPCNPIDSQSIVACKVCMKRVLGERTVDLTDCYFLDRVSLHRLVHRAYRYEGIFNRVPEEDSELYEDIPHGNRLHLPLLQLLMKYYGIRYTEGDGAHSCEAHLRLGLKPILLDTVDIEILPTFRTGDSYRYDRIKCIVQYENDINELLQTTQKILPKIPDWVTLIYQGKKENYYLYEDTIALDVSLIQEKLEKYFSTKGNYEKEEANEMKTSDSSIKIYIKELKELARLYNVHYQELKSDWARWYEDKHNRPFNKAKIVVTLPLKHKPLDQIINSICNLKTS